MKITPRPLSRAALAAVLLVLALALPEGAGPAAAESGACRDSGESTPSRSLASAIGPVWAWVRAQTGLPQDAEPPELRLVPERCLRAEGHEGQAALGIEAMYSRADAIVFLHLRWWDATLATRSILVHEFVHHAQQVGGRRFACPAEAEKQAYALQETWLAQYGLDLERAIGLDRMTRLVLTVCTM